MADSLTLMSLQFFCNSAQQTVLRLKRHGNLIAHRLGRGDDELKLPPREVRQADVVDFAGLYRLIEKQSVFLPRCVHVGSVQLIEVDRLNPSWQRDAFSARWRWRRDNPTALTSGLPPNE
jgi:hypothetical protein